MEINSDDILFVDKNNTSLIITFGGIKNGIGMPVFEFKKILSSYKNYNQYFFRDKNQSWYHHGLEGIANNIDEFIENLKLITTSYDKVIFIGNSMGGYAAVLFGVLLKVDKIIAFSPQTFIDKYRRIFYQDNRWSKQINKVYKLNTNSQYFNLKKVMKNSNYDSKIKIFYSSSDRLDEIHVNRIKKLKNVKVLSYKVGGHNLVRELRGNNTLSQILNDSLL